MFRFLLDNTEYEDPLNWAEFQEKITRDDDNGIFWVEYTRTLVFSGAAYAYMRGEYDNNFQCAIIELEIQHRCDNGIFEPYFKSQIYTSSARWDLEKCTVECQIFDNTFAGKIRQNFDVPFGIRSEFSKNGTSVTPLASGNVQLFNPNTGVYSNNVGGFDLFDVLQQLILLMTDDEVDFASSWYSTLPDDEKIWLCQGANFRTPSSTNYTLTFGEVYREIRKKFPLFLYTDATGSKPVLRMELETDLIGASSFIVDQPKSINETNDVGRLYGRVKVGSNEQVSIKERGATFNLPFIDMIAFVEEEYTFEYLCNANNTLDLVNNYLIDHNALEDIIINATTDYDDRFVFAQYNDTVNQFTQNAYLGTQPPYLYNEIFLNREVIDRREFPASVTKPLGNDNDLFEAQEQVTTGRSAAIPINATPLTTFSSTMPFSTVISDPNANYNNVTYQYTAPAGGNASFEVEIRLSSLSYTNPDPITGVPTDELIRIQLAVNGGARFEDPRKLELRDTSTGDVYDTFINGDSVDLFDIIANNGNTDLTLIAWFDSIYLGSGDTVDAGLIYSAHRTAGPANTFNFTTGQNDRYEATVFTTSGGVWSDKNPNDYFKILLDFDFWLPLADWKQIRDDLTKSFSVNFRNERFNVLTKEINRNVQSGETQFKVYKRL